MRWTVGLFAFAAVAVSRSSRIQPAQRTMTPAPIKPSVSVAELEKVDIRVGTIREVLDVPGSDKLVRLVVSFGDHQRSILAGIKKERTDPGALAGKQASSS